MKNTPPTRSNVIVLKQMLNLIPRGRINRHALETGVEAKARTFSVLSHLSAMLFAQLSHAIGLNDVCDWLRLKSGVLARYGVTPPSKNSLSNANMDRSSDFAEKLFWSVLAHLHSAKTISGPCKIKVQGAPRPIYGTAVIEILEEKVRGVDQIPWIIHAGKNPYW